MNMVSKTFRSGNSEAVRLPKELAFGIGAEVVMERNGDTLTIRRAKDPQAERAKLHALLNDLQAIGTSGDGPAIDHRIEFPERKGL